MYTNSKIFSIVSKPFSFSSFVFLLLILVSSSSTIAPSLNSNNISNAYGQAGNSGNENNDATATASAQVGDQIQPLGNNLQNAKTISPDSRLILSPSQDSKVEKNTNNNPSLPDLSFKSPSQDSKAEKTVTQLSDSKSSNFNYKRAQGIAHITVITKI